MEQGAEDAPVVYLHEIKRQYTQGATTLTILNGAKLALWAGQSVALVAPSGAGKSTLLHIAGLLESPDEGEVYIGGAPTSGLSDAERTQIRRTEIGFVYQSHHLLPDFTALENLLLPQYIAGVGKKEAAHRASKLLESVGLAARAEHYPAEMSGGEQQRVAIARALVNRPALLLADEPTGNLDPQTAEDVFQVLVQTIRSLRIGALVVTHNESLAARMDRVLRLENGTV